MFIKYSHACREWHQQRKRQSGKSSFKHFSVFASLIFFFLHPHSALVLHVDSLWTATAVDSNFFFPLPTLLFLFKSHTNFFLLFVAFVEAERELGYGKRKRNEAQKVAFKYRSIMTAQSQVVLYYSTFHLFPFNYFFRTFYLLYCMVQLNAEKLCLLFYFLLHRANSEDGRL